MRLIPRWQRPPHSYVLLVVFPILTIGFRPSSLDFDEILQPDVSPIGEDRQNFSETGSFFETFHAEETVAGGKLSSQFTLKSVSEQDKEERRTTHRGLHPAMAQRAFDQQLREALRSAQLQVKQQHSEQHYEHEQQLQPSDARDEPWSAQGNTSFLFESAEAEPKPPKNPLVAQYTKDQIASLDSWKSQIAKFIAIRAANKAEYDKEKMDNLKAPLLPEVAVTLCTQVNIDLTPSFSFVETRLNFGLSGTIGIDAATGCWKGNLEVGVGTDIIFAVGGAEFAFGVTATGDLSFEEQAPGNLPSLESEDGTVIYAPDGADLSKCHSKSPWPMFQTFWETQLKRWAKVGRWFKSKEKRNLSDALNKASTNSYKKDFDYIFGGTMTDADRPQAVKNQYPFMTAPRLMQHAWVFTDARRAARNLLPAYATQVLLRLAENPASNVGADNERSFPTSSETLLRFQKSDGRFLARWPDKSTLAFYKDSSDQDLKVEGVVQPTADMRVINFAKVVRLTEHKKDPSFWKELAISATNLMVRAMKDSVAIISAVWAGNPNWDGSCDTLPPFFSMDQLYDEGKRKKVFQDYAFASQDAWVDDRLAFLKNLKLVDKEHKDRWMYPLIWCRMAEERFDDSKKPSLKDLISEGEDAYVGKVEQACTSATHVFRKVKPNDKIEWKEGTDPPWEEVSNVYVVTSEGEEKPSGILWYQNPSWDGPLAEGNLVEESTTGAKIPQHKEYVVAERLVEARPECEEVRIPKPLVALMPGLVRQFRAIIKDLEHGLVHINGCMHELLNSPGWRKVIWAYEKSRSDADKRQYPLGCDVAKVMKLGWMQRHAGNIIKKVRDELTRLGGAFPQDDSQKLNEILYDITGKPKELADELDTELWTNFGYWTSHERPVIDFKGLQPGDAHGECVVDDPIREKGFLKFVKVPNSGVDISKCEAEFKNRKIQFQKLNGEFWGYGQAVKEKVLAHPQPLRCLQQKEVKLRPPVLFSAALTGTWQTEQNGFCTTNTGALMTALSTEWVWKSWAEEVPARGWCFEARIRPGATWVKLSYCWGKEKGKLEHREWKISYKAGLMSVDSSSSGWSGVFSILSKAPIHGMGALSSTLAAAFGGFLNNNMMDLYYDKFQQHPVAANLMTVGAAGLSFNLALFQDDGFDSFADGFMKWLNPPSSSDPTTVKGVVSIVGSVTWARQDVMMDNGKVKSESSTKTSVKLHGGVRLESSKVSGLMGGLKTDAQFWAEAVVDTDVTPWFTAQEKSVVFQENEDRQDRCAKCLGASKGFCDTRPKERLKWSPAHDVCVSNTTEAKTACKASQDASLQGVWYDELQLCAGIGYSQPNEGPVMEDLPPLPDEQASL